MQSFCKIRSVDNGHAIQKTFLLPDGTVEKFSVTKDRDSVVIFAITPEQEVILTLQFRPHTERVELELPGGGLEENEGVIMAGTRELKEETGFVGEIHHLASVPYSAKSTGKRHMCMALNCQQTYVQQLDKNEHITVVKTPVEKFKKLMRHGRVRGFECAYLAMEKLGML